MIKKLKQYIKDVLGITRLETEISMLRNKNQSICDKLETHSRWLNEMNSDNKLILRHIKFINSEFFVMSDINNPKHQPSVVLILHRGSQEVIKTYTFNNRTVEEIHNFLEGFGKDNNFIDQPLGFRGPRYRY